MDEDDVYNSGIGSIFGPYFNQKVRYSALPDTAGRALYREDPTFSERLVAEYGYPAERHPEYGYERIKQDGRPPEYNFLPNAEELYDARAHILGSLFAAEEVGDVPAAILGWGKEIVDRGIGIVRSPFLPRGGISEIIEDSRMDVRNNAVGRQLLKKAGLNPTDRQLTQLADDAIFEQLERLRGRGQLDTSVKEGQPQLYFPRDEQGRFALQQYRQP